MASKNSGALLKGLKASPIIFNPKKIIPIPNRTRPICLLLFVLPNKKGKIPKTNTIPLSKLESGTKGKVMGVTLDEKAFLDYLTKLNICIGTEIKLLETISFDQSLSIKIENTNQHISSDVAKHLLIKIEN